MLAWGFEVLMTSSMRRTSSMRMRRKPPRKVMALLKRAGKRARRKRAGKRARRKTKLLTNAETTAEGVQDEVVRSLARC